MRTNTAFANVDNNYIFYNKTKGALMVPDDELWK